MAKFCSKCGCPIKKEGAAFCTECGAKLPLMEATKPAPAVSPAPAQAPAGTNAHTSPAAPVSPTAVPGKPEKQKKTKGKKSKIIIPIAIIVILLLLIGSFIFCLLNGYFGLDSLKEKIFPDKESSISISMSKKDDKKSDKNKDDKEDADEDEDEDEDEVKPSSEEASEPEESNAPEEEDEPAAEEPKSEKNPENKPSVSEKPAELPFVDVEGHWAENAVRFAYENKLFSGVSETQFQPGMNMTRYMLMTVLARLDGVDTSGGEYWYTKGMEWTIENGISDGSNGGADITREQMITMLWRYAGKPGGSYDFSAYEDEGSISPWAKDALCWAVSEGLMKGRSDTVLAPGGTATRAEVATILMRYSELN